MCKALLIFPLYFFVSHNLYPQYIESGEKGVTRDVQTSADSIFSFEDAKFYKSDAVSIGPGFGIDYGGLGGNLLIYPNALKRMGLFGGVGYYFLGPGFNVGTKFRLVQDSTWNINPYVAVMYGSNSAVIVDGAGKFDKMFHGFSFSLGLDQKWKYTKWGYMTFALIVPIRSEKMKVYIDDLKTNHGFELQRNFFPIGISIGYRFVLK